MITDIHYGESAQDNIVTTLTPEINWTYYDTEPTIQEQYQIQVGTDEDWTFAEMWDTGPVVSSESNVVYSGAALTEENYYFLRIRVFNGSEWTEWAASWFYVNLIWVIHIPDDFQYSRTNSNARCSISTSLMFASSVSLGPCSREDSRVSAIASLIAVSSRGSQAR